MTTCRATETVCLIRVTLEFETDLCIVHRGFKERIFPEKSTSSRSPYGGLSIARLFPGAYLDYILISETILRGVDIVSKDLIERLERRGESARINVYFTGTSYSIFPSNNVLLNLLSRSLTGMRNLDPCVR